MASRSKRGPSVGRRYPITEEWRTLTRQRLAVKRWSQTDLARAIGTTRAAISFVLVTAKGSALIPAIDSALDGATTSAVVRSDDSTLADAIRLVRLFEKLTAENRIRALERIETLLSVQGKE